MVVKYCCSILYQRGIYPPEEFERVQNYGCPLMITTDKALKAYIKNVMHQLSGILCFIHLYFSLMAYTLLIGT